MDPRRHLLRNAWITLLASLAFAAALALPGRAGAADIEHTIAYGSIGPISGPAFLGVFEPSLLGSIGNTFLDHFTFTVVPSNSFTLTTTFLPANASGVSFSSADLYSGATLLASGPLGNITSTPTLAPGAYDLRVSGTLTATSGFYSGSVNFNSTTAPIPEPETYAMMLAGLGLMGFVARRRKQVRLLA